MSSKPVRPEEKRSSTSTMDSTKTLQKGAGCRGSLASDGRIIDSDPHGRAVYVPGPPLPRPAPCPPQPYLQPTTFP
ncbi:AsmA family protein YhjG [Clarias magur]|uniref:AsmA family protein YhjG n=1 Tax=Clarias magur TaxID=1594786 RepID=A0A8J4T413_CLAMG|nr:AsmA family protein YhjG [Clarias magur]